MNIKDVLALAGVTGKAPLPKAPKITPALKEVIDILADDKGHTVAEMAVTLGAQKTTINDRILRLSNLIPLTSKKVLNSKNNEAKAWFLGETG